MSLDALELDRVHAALGHAQNELLAARTAEGHWVGELSASALSTATAVTALAVAERSLVRANSVASVLIHRGLDWLSRHQNPDGGWGDTIRSVSNLSTTTLCWAAFGAVPSAAEVFQATVSSAEVWLAQKSGSLEPSRLAAAVIARYGRDRTFSVPILTMCALVGRLGSSDEAWMPVLPLPFELAALPHQFFAALRLPVVSYALPALIAIGQARHFHRPSRNPFARFVRTLTKARSLEVLEKIQPSNGGFLEATPLTSFVVMSLAGSGQVHHPVTRRGLEFLRASVRPDGSWPIDTNLATWVTTLSVNALGSACHDLLAVEERSRIRRWLLAQQFKAEHPYTHAAPGAWAWTDLPGGVPDADDTAGALLALHNLGDIDDEARVAAGAGVEWLLNVQNRDGGIPTFCRGWGALPFDRSGADLTAHALRAWVSWLKILPSKQQTRVQRAIQRGVNYLARTQRADGAWIPLWFGNQYAHGDENPVYGTARVVRALEDLQAHRLAGSDQPLQRGLEWLASAQRSDGAWGDDGGGTGTVEETAQAIEALAAARRHGLALNRAERSRSAAVNSALTRGLPWLVERIERRAWTEAAPIGFYFAKLWYCERLYPLIFTVAALNEAAKPLGDGSLRI